MVVGESRAPTGYYKTELLQRTTEYLAPPYPLIGNNKFDDI